MDPNDERRKFPRIPRELITFLRRVHNSENEYFPLGTTQNLSQGGVFIETNETFDLGNLLELKIALPQGQKPICFVGSVRWCKGTNSAGIGVEFVQISESDKDRLIEFLEG